MLLSRTNGATSVILRVKLLDSSVTTGAGLTGLTSASSGLIISTIASNEATATTYTAAGSTIETITTLGTYAAPTATKCRFKEVDATNHKGIYEIHFADARFAVSGSKHLTVSISGATNLAQCDFVIDQATQVDVTSVAGTAQTARDLGASVLLSSGTGTGQVSLSSGRVNSDVVYWNGSAVATPDTAGYPKTTIKSGTGTGEISLSSGGVSIKSAGIAAAQFAADAIDANALATNAVAEITAAIKALVIETNGSITVGQALSLILAACSGVTSSGGTVLKDPSGTSTRITATVDGSNNRTAMTVTPSA